MPSQQQRDEGDTGAARRGPAPLVCEMFQGINTATTRAGVPDQQMFWCDGFIPLSPRNLRVIPGIGAALYTAPGGVTIACYYAYNLGSTPYLAVFQSDGSIIQVRTTDGATTTILGAASGVVNPSPTTIGVAQSGQKYLLMVVGGNSGFGYGIWDGNILFGSGAHGLAPGVTLTNVGSGYVTAPSVQFTGGGGSGATAAATINAGVVTGVTITNPGSGYTSAPTVSFVGGQQVGSGAALTAHLSSIPGGSGGVLTPNFTFFASSSGINAYDLTSVSITTPGSGYSSNTTATWVTPPARGNPSDNSFVGGPPAITVTVTGGAITALTVIPADKTWTTLTSSPQFPTITVTDQATSQFTVTSVTGTPTGTNYSPQATIVASAGGSPVTQATITPVIASGVITGTNIVNGGVYGSNTPPTLTVNDVAVSAAATVMLMPSGVGGTTIETYAGHVWIANGPLVQFSAPGSVSDFSTANGGGSFTSSDSFLRVGYTKLIQTNGFLFLIGDSSMNYISGVQTNTPMGGSPTTTFTNNNSDPEIGTPYPCSVTTLSQDIFLANQDGVWVSSGGTFQKKSEPLDGIYNTAPGVFNGMQLSASKALIFGKLVWMVLVPITDPITKTTRNKLFMFNEKYWWSSEQDVTLTFIAGQEINSVFTTYGTDGTHIYPLFKTPSTAFTKRMQTRLWDAPAGIDHTKSSVNLFAIAQFLGAANLTYNVSIDNENGGTGQAGPYAHSGTTADMEVFSVMPPTVIGQIGVLTGMTVTTTADDLVLVSLAMQNEVVQYRA